MLKNKKTGAYSPVWTSQNFLTSGKTIKKLINLTSLNKTDTVIEIGAGKGHITKSLMESCKQITAFEIDSNLYKKLQDKFLPSNNLILKHEDFLTSLLPLKSKYKIFSNIPFNITTKIIQKLIDCKNPPQEAWLIMEKGAAIRFCGKSRESFYSLLLKPLFDMKIVYYFKKEDFHPKPSVDIVMLHFKKKSTLDIPFCQRKAYVQFIRKSMDHGLSYFFTKKQFSTALSKGSLHQGFITGEILYIQWLCLFRYYMQINHLN